MNNYEVELTGVGKRSGLTKTIVRSVTAENFRGAVDEAVKKSLANFNKGATIERIELIPMS